MSEAIIYARFSKADQAKGHTIERQLRYTREVCARLGLTATPELTFIEHGKSAFTGANRAKGSLLANLEIEIEAGAHRGRTLCIEHLDRISRQGHDEVRDFLRACSDGGVTVATRDGSRVYPAGERVQMLEVIEVILKAELARAESDNKSRRVRESFAAKREKAVAGEGKRIASRPPSWIKRLDDGFELIEDRAEIVREAHRLCQLGYGTAQIARMFNERGFKPWRPSSSGWHESYINRMLSMRSAIGEYISTLHGTRILDYYPAVVTVDCFDRTQASKAKRRKQPGGRRGVAQSNLFQGIARCSHCGGTMIMKPSRTIGRLESRVYATGNKGATKTNTAASYLVCNNAKRRFFGDDGKQLCMNKTGIRYQRLEPAVLDKIMTLAMDNDRYNIKEVSNTRITLADIERRLSHHRGELETLKANLKIRVSATLLDMLGEVEDTIAAVIVERDALAIELNRERGSRPSASFLLRIADTREAMSSDDLETRRDARTMVHDSLKEVLTDILCDDQGHSVVVVANGLAAFRVASDGGIDWQHDSSGDPAAVRALTTEAFADNRPTVEAVISRARRR